MRLFRRGLVPISNRRVQPEIGRMGLARLSPFLGRRALRSATELTANVTMAFAAVVASVFLIHRLVTEPSPLPEPPVVYEPSERLPEGLPPSIFDAERVVLVHVRSSCGYCTDSMAFYRRLARHQAPGLKLVVVSEEPEAVLVTYLDKQGLKPAQIVRIEPGYFRNSTTPLVIVANSSRTVLGSWLGLLEQEREQEVLGLLGL